jgi:hypothetical protein
MLCTMLCLNKKSTHFQQGRQLSWLVTGLVGDCSPYYFTPLYYRPLDPLLVLASTSLLCYFIQFSSRLHILFPTKEGDTF